MKWAIAAIIGLGIGTVHAEEFEMPIMEYDKLIEQGYQLAGITPDGRGGQVYHLQKSGVSFYTCHAEVLVAGVRPNVVGR